MQTNMVVGLDEVGRGSWAGPLLAAAVILDEANMPAGLNDSKKLSVAKRQLLDIQIRDSAIAYGIGWVWPEQIDQLGLTKSVSLAMSSAIQEVIQVLITKDCNNNINVTEISNASHVHYPQPTNLEIMIDGSYNFLPAYARVATIVKADGLIPAVSAASIIAKVARDTYMKSVAHTMYPHYEFDRHVGYGTTAHSKALATYGVTPIHRASYKPIQKLL